MYYTWMDIEWKLKSDRINWPESWVSVEVYSSELIIYHTGAEKDFSSTSEYLGKIFGANWDKNNIINLQITDKQMQVIFEHNEDDAIRNPVPLPLFKQSFLGESYPLNSALEPLPVPVIAFHSYKGGVGRTLSLLSLVRELTLNTKYKTLVIDADIEAPGLTLMVEGFPAEKRISYLDILSIIHDSERDNLFREIVRNVAKSMSTSTIKVPAKDTTEEHYFLPAYRIDYQLLDNFVHPEHIVSMPGRVFIISEFLSELGKQLKIDAVIIDLRAGLSELSAPILFDPRVRRIFVTSTSQQSTKGTKFILDAIFKSPLSQKSILLEAREKQEIISPTILLTMVPPREFDEEKIEKIKQDLRQKIPEDFYKTEEISEPDDETLSDIVIHSEHDAGLIHLESLQQISKALSGTSTARASEILVKRVVSVSNSHSRELNVSVASEDRDRIIQNIHDLVLKEVTAEGTSIVNMMATEALENLAKDYGDNIPKLVIIGAKGSGKTYIYKQLLNNVYWERFTSSVLSEEPPEHPNVLIVPILATTNRTQFSSFFAACFDAINKNLNTMITSDILNKNESILNRYKDNMSLKQADWGTVWQSIFLDSLSQNNMFKNFAELDLMLSTLDRRIIFIIDGLEDIFNQTISSENSKTALRVLCQDFINSIANYKNIGILVFIRSDMIQSSIQINYTQFRDQYASYTLKWTQDEALRLVIWILSQINFSDYAEKKDIIPKLTHDALSEYLNPFWGQKLGKASSNEAYSSRWIIAALSDLNRQLQARDIIRFLLHATANRSKDTYYHDRFLLPGDIRNAIDPCSKAKLEDITAEMKNLEPVFKKLENIPLEKKELPLPLDNTVINSDDREQLETQGYLRSTKEGYYFPEIIRHALGYKYHRGARPRVLSLLIDNKNISG